MKGLLSCPTKVDAKHEAISVMGRRRALVGATFILARISLASMLLLSSCSDLPSAESPGMTNPRESQGQGRLGGCIPASASLSLLGIPGDSPILPVQVQGQKAAMFFSPGFVPLLFRNNGPISFQKLRHVYLRQQDGDVLSASASIASSLSVGDLKAADRTGYLLPDPDDRTVNGRPIIGMLGRDILPGGAVVELDIPGRRITFSIPQVGCPSSSRPPPGRSISMQQEVLLVPVQINGQLVQAVLDPDLPVSVLPSNMANTVGLSSADLANDKSVVTKFGKSVLGRRHHVKTLDVGDVRLQDFAFDVEDGVQYAMLGLNFFELGQAVFDFSDLRFSFTQTTKVLPSPTGLHFDQTRVAHVSVNQ